VRRLMGKVASDKCHKWVFKEPSDCEPNISNYWQSSFDAVTIYSFIYFLLISTLLSLLYTFRSGSLLLFHFPPLQRAPLWFPLLTVTNSSSGSLRALQLHLHTSASACNVLFDYLRFWSLSFSVKQ
jgi:hypothetical protein